MSCNVWAHVAAKDIAAKAHGLKYSLVYIVNGERVVGYDNELGKGDHKHVQDNELSYQFKNVGQLIADFKTDIERLYKKVHKTAYYQGLVPGTGIEPVRPFYRSDGF